MLRPNNVFWFTRSYYKAICDSEGNESRWPLSNVYLLDAIPEKTLINIKKIFDGVVIGTPLLLISTSFWGSGKSGILLTDGGLYLKLSEKGRSKDTLAEMSLDEISKISLGDDYLLINNIKYDCSPLFVHPENRVLMKDFFNGLSSGLLSVKKESVEKIWKPDKYSEILSQVFERWRDEFFYKIARSIAPDEKYLDKFSQGSRKLIFTSKRIILCGNVSSQNIFLRSEVTEIKKIRKKAFIPEEVYGPNPYKGGKTLSELGMAIAVEAFRHLTKKGAEEVVSVIDNKWSIVIKTNRRDRKKDNFESVVAFEELTSHGADLALAAAKRAGVSVETT